MQSVAVMGKLYYGDNLHILKTYIMDESIDLIYLDPLVLSPRPSEYLSAFLVSSSIYITTCLVMKALLYIVIVNSCLCTTFISVIKNKKPESLYVTFSV